MSVIRLKMMVVNPDFWNAGAPRRYAAVPQRMEEGGSTDGVGRGLVGEAVEARVPKRFQRGVAESLLTALFGTHNLPMSAVYLVSFSVKSYS